MSRAPVPDLEAWLRLALVPGLGASAQRQLLKQFGSPEATLGASQADLARTIDRDSAARIRAGGDDAAVGTVLAWLTDPANHIVTLADPEYPQALLQTTDPPVLLYVKGNRDLLNRPAFAIVGSRSATPQGVDTAETFARTLSDAGLAIVSGLALGIDAAAHRGGLAGTARSIAVVGTGLDIVYPARNRDLAHALARDGVLVSEFPLGTPALASNFPRRNRLIAGLALGCLVVEAALKSGSLITARLAAELGREVFAIPGSIHSTHAKGCHWLIKQGAKLVDGALDILEELKIPAPSSNAAAVRESIGGDYRPLLDAMGFDPCAADTLIARSGLSAETVAAMLLELELAGQISALPGGKYQRMR